MNGGHFQLVLATTIHGRCHVGLHELGCFSASPAGPVHDFRLLICACCAGGNDRRLAIARDEDGDVTGLPGS
jgi:hypothetical protein